MKEIENKIRYLTKYSYENVSFYNTLFKENHIHPNQIKNINDLNKIPIITKTELRKVPLKDLISKEYKEKKLHHISTGGSTGEPFTIHISDTEKEWRQAIQLRANMHIGQKFYHRWASMDNDLEYKKNRNNTPVFPHVSIPTLWNDSRKIEKLGKFKPQVLDGLSSSLWSLAKAIQDTKSKDIKPRLVFGTGELISSSSRNLIENAFETPFFDQISSTEVGRTAWECHEKIGYHMNIDSIITQFVDEEGNEVSPGERGEIVYTSLHNLAMPIIRYNIRDIGVSMDDECSCRVNLPLMKMIEGRRNSFIVLPNGAVISPWRFIEEMRLYFLSDKIERYKVIQRRINLIEIQINKKDDMVDETEIIEFIHRNLTKNGLMEIKYDIKFVKSIPTTRRGKLNVVTSDLKDVPIL